MKHKYYGKHTIGMQNISYFCTMGTLYLVPTPVGNLEDMTMRALRILKEADLVLAEDTRTSGILFKHFDIHTPLQSYHKFNEHQAVGHVVERLKAGSTIAVVSDAGTPGISDPGFLIAREACKAGIEVITLPGATAFVPALVSSGLPCDKFCFEGFLPQKKGRLTRLEQLKNEERTIIFYESPYRITKTLQQFIDVFGCDRLVSVCREISKIHEESVRGTLQEALHHFEEHEPRGEFVIVLAGADDASAQTPASHATDPDEEEGNENPSTNQDGEAERGDRLREEKMRQREEKRRLREEKRIRKENRNQDKRNRNLDV